MVDISVRSMITVSEWVFSHINFVKIGRIERMAYILKGDIRVEILLSLSL